MNSFKRVSIVGIGLLGGSLAKVMRKLGLANSIVGYGRNKANLEEAKNLNIIDDATFDIQSDDKTQTYEIWNINYNNFENDFKIMIFL